MKLIFFNFCGYRNFWPGSWSGSGSTDLIESGSSADPDPKPCLQGSVLSLQGSILGLQASTVSFPALHAIFLALKPDPDSASKINADPDQQDCHDRNKSTVLITSYGTPRIFWVATILNFGLCETWCRECSESVIFHFVSGSLNTISGSLRPKSVNSLSDPDHHICSYIFSPFQVDTHWMFESGIVDVFVMLGPGPKDVSRQYGRLTGQPL